MTAYLKGNWGIKEDNAYEGQHIVWHTANDQ